MLEILHFLLGSFWTWLGAATLLFIAVQGVVRIAFGALAILAAVFAPGMARIVVRKRDEP